MFMFWAKKEHARTREVAYAERISGYVIDSPGAADLMEALCSGISFENARDKEFATKLNVHNFCPMPTPASTFGAPTGSIWHLPAMDEASEYHVLGAFADVTKAHAFSVIYEGFDSKTVFPATFRRMDNWPRASYAPGNFVARPAVSTLQSVVCSVASVTASVVGWSAGANCLLMLMFPRPVGISSPATSLTPSSGVTS